MRKLFLLLFTLVTLIFPAISHANDTTNSIFIRTVDSSEAVQYFNDRLKENWGMVSRNGFGENSYIGKPFSMEYQREDGKITHLFYFPIITNGKAISYVEQGFSSQEDNSVYWAVSEFAFTQENMNKLKTGKVYSLIRDRSDHILAIADDGEVIVLHELLNTTLKDDGEVIESKVPLDYDPPYEGMDTVVVDIMAKADNIDTSPIIPQTEEEKAVIENARKNGKPYSSINISDSGIIDENNRLLVPLRDISEFMNCEIDWNATEKAAYIKKDNTTVKFIIGSTQYYINDEIHYLDSPAQIYNDKTYIPFRSAGEALGIDIAYNPHTKNIVFSY